ncbi:PREDICTED: uncharacterized protein LOC106821202 isoform X2 [Priapulus caudatus]|uniref:Uncharacterized protein LOC106821202 isoform X2 n=1 Tax=Priapulus caudatus TaxID=37621 RepID=A0ABM1FAD3_PRICU|nr:PREDICTED: uncharacterized protein LOC106821202 isoform X2 [Priapulus caudatus]
MPIHCTQELQESNPMSWLPQPQSSRSQVSAEWQQTVPAFMPWTHVNAEAVPFPAVEGCTPSVPCQQFGRESQPVLCRSKLDNVFGIPGVVSTQPINHNASRHLTTASLIQCCPLPTRQEQFRSEGEPPPPTVVPGPVHLSTVISEPRADLVQRVPTMSGPWSSLLAPSYTDSTSSLSTNPEGVYTTAWHQHESMVTASSGSHEVTPPFMATHASRPAASSIEIDHQLSQDAPVSSRCASPPYMHGGYHVGSSGRFVYNKDWWKDIPSCSYSPRKQKRKKNDDNFFVGNSDGPPRKVLVNEERMASRMQQMHIDSSSFSSSLSCGHAAYPNKMSGKDILDEINERLVLTSDEEEDDVEKAAGLKLKLSEQLKKTLAVQEPIIPRKLLDRVKRPHDSMQLVLWQPNNVVNLKTSSSPTVQNGYDRELSSQNEMQPALLDPATQAQLAFQLSPEATNNNTLPLAHTLCLMPALSVPVQPPLPAVQTDADDEMEL